MTSDFIRRVMWWSLLINTPAGVSYSAKDVAEWTATKARDAGQPWREALLLPGAGAMAPLADCFNPIEFWRLRPDPRVVILQPGTDSLRNHIAANVTEAGDLVLLYVPEEREVNILPGAWPATANAMWFNPRTGESRPAGATVVSPTGWKFSTPSAGDWVLVVHIKK